MTPHATYRVQLHKGFDFDAAASLAPYLARLGISHLYASPYLKAHPGSTHGYDIVDHERFNPELGGEAGFLRLVEALSAEGLGHILDFVPNHMGVGGADNAIWLEVLEWGPEADHAGWFDIDWDTDRGDLKNKLLVPFLGDQYGVALDAGHLLLKFDADEGSFSVWAHETHRLPICPLDYALILGQDDPALDKIGDSFTYLLRWKPQVGRRAATLKRELASLAKSPSARAAIASAVSAINGRAGEGASWARLHALIERQNWRPAHFLVAADDINYRRFFNIATLAGLRMELPDVFDHTHGLVFRLMGNGQLDGLRIDHVDGLFDPKGYFEALRRHCPKSRDGSDPYLVVEKILGREETLREDWPIDGTTGYEFTNLLTGVFVQAQHEGAFTRSYWRFTGEVASFASIVLASKLQIIDNEMSSELHRLARSATRVARQNTRTADFTLTVLQRALRQIVAAFPVYRTYIDGESAVSPEDLRQLEIAISTARINDHAIDPSVFDFLARLLSGELVAHPRSGYQRSAVFRCAMKLQQYCGPVMAKGVEDTAFYRYNRFVALNEVGGSPDHFGVSVGEFHEANRIRAERWPASMLGTSTHDTKRGEDTRARLAALSALPDEWEAEVAAWSETLRDGQATVAGPDRNDEYLFYQLLVGTWPAELLGERPSEAGLDAYAERLKSVMTKSAREAKSHSTWVAPDTAYEESMLQFVDRALRGTTAARFLSIFRPFAERIAELGAAVTFAQTVLKFTVPGMPDIYQGSELWDLTMVDPDNRRPIDYTVRGAVLSQVTELLASDPRSAMTHLFKQWRDGRFKLALTATLLGLRSREPDLLLKGDYVPILVQGDDSVCAFARTHGASSIVVVALRAFGGPVAATTVAWPEPLSNRQGVSLLTGAPVAGTGSVEVSPLLDGVPATVVMFGAN